MINLYDILDAADGQLFGDPAAQIFTAFSFDPRQVKQGDLYVALKTEDGDGHLYMEEAIKAGALGLMCTHPPNFETQGITVVIMRDVEGSLMRWAKYILEKYNPTVVAVAGTQGKTTTCAAIAHLLKTQYHVYYQPAQISGRYAIPLALSGLTAEHQLVVLEVDSTYTGEMAEIMSYIPVTVGVVVSLTGEENSLPAQHIQAEIAALISKLPPDGLAVLNFDHTLVRKLSQYTSTPVLSLSVDRTGTSFGADLTAYNLVIGLDKTGFDMRYGSERYLAKWVPLLGAHQLYGVLAAVAVGLAFQVPLEDGLKALTYLKPLAGRLQALLGLNGSLLIDDTYHGSVASFKAALNWLMAVRPAPSTRETQTGQVSPRGAIYVIVGDLDQWDAKAQSEISQLGRQLVEVASVIVTLGEQSSALARAALENGLSLARTHMTFSHQDAIYAIRADLTPKDVVFVTGNAFARMERVAQQLLADELQSALLPRAERLMGETLHRQPLYHSWVEIDLEAIAHNTRQIRALIGEKCQLMAVVKSDAYGHGAIPVSTTAVLNGADYLGVATLEEALSLRLGGITAPILILGYVPPTAAGDVLKHQLAVTVFDQAALRGFNRVAAAAGEKIRVHIRLDVGLGGVGVVEEDIAMFFRAIIRMDSLIVEGLYTILGLDRLDEHLTRFEAAIKLARIGEVNYELCHVAGSALALHIPETHLEMVRIGKALYGLTPHPDYPLNADFRRALTWKTTVAQVKRQMGRMELDNNGIPFTTKTRTVAILPVGYSDGLHYRRTGASWKYVLIKGQKAAVVEQVDMYQTLVDVSDIDDVRPGDEVVLIGEQDGEIIRVEDIAEMLTLYPEEVLTVLMARQLRVK